jgi:hypothetical protein
LLINPEIIDHLEERALNVNIIFERATRKRLEKHGMNLAQIGTS